MITSRQKLILKAIIEEYEKEGTPVGSKMLTDLPYLGFSSATLRYDMAELEKLGFIEKTHSSSGRIPSEWGYKYYLENLVTRDDGVQEAFPLIDKIIKSNETTAEKAIEEAIKLLSEITNYAAVAVGPRGKQHRIKKIDFVPTNSRLAIVLVITDKGEVIHNHITISENVMISDVANVIKTLNDVFVGKTIEDAKHILELENATSEINQLMEYQKEVFDSFLRAFTKFTDDNFFLSGITNVFDKNEFKDIEIMKKMFDMFERRQFAKVMLNENDAISIKIGNDMILRPMEEYTVISIPYKIGDHDEGKIAVFGPKRMEYKKVIPLLEYIASHIGKLYRK